MGIETAIAWCHHTINFWWGCEKVSPACAHCYAEWWDKFTGGDHWGARKPRRFIKSAVDTARKLNAVALAAGERRRVFCMSMGDLFEDFPGLVVNSRGIRLLLSLDGRFTLDPNDNYPKQVTLDDLRERFVWPTLRECTALDWMLLTKRPENLARMLPDDLKGAPHLWLGTTVENRNAMWRLDHLLSVPAPVHFVSAEPQFEEINFRPFLRWSCMECDWGDEPSEDGTCANCGGGPVRAPIDQLITGGESKQGKDHKPAPYNIDWARSIIGQCREFGGVPFVKQLGSRPVHRDGDWMTFGFPSHVTFSGIGTGRVDVHLRDKKGETPSEWPEDLRVQEFPVPRVINA